MKHPWLRRLFRRRTLVVCAAALQAAFLVLAVLSGSRLTGTLRPLLAAGILRVVLSTAARKERGAFKALWIFLILTFPVLGGILYLLTALQSSLGPIKKKLPRSQAKAAPLYGLPGDGYARAKEAMGKHFQQVKYLQNHGKFPVYTHTKTTYYPSGEGFHQELLAQLRQAQDYIFLEYFIIQPGRMWDPILAILKEKAAAGVKVRVLYDDLGCFFLLPPGYGKELEQAGIECVPFNPFRPVLTVEQNNRDHRKLAVIDGKVAFTGGINLADEYINAYEKHGHWKDTAVKIEGKAAWSFALMFLELWEVCSERDEDFAGYCPWQAGPCPVESDGFVLPYGDSPLDEEPVGEHVYLQILNEAEDYVYINTPYLIPDDQLVSALCLAAKRGVDVRIVTPHRWDKRLVHLTTRSYYRELLQGGVKVYEYGRGFLHAKSFVSDDCIAAIGTTNLDFRSLYLHFECGVWLWGSAAVLRMKEDFPDTLAHCRRIREQDCAANPAMALVQEVLRLFSPLM